MTGLDRADRERVIDAVRALPRAADPGLAGLVEAHGVLFDLSVETLQLFGLDSDLDPIIRRSDLPGLADDAPVARLSTEQFLANTPDGLFPELDAARARQRSARETLSILREAADRARNDHADAAARLRQAATALADAGRREEAARAGAALDEAMGPAADRDELIATEADLVAQLERLEQGLDELSGLDTRPIQVLLDAIRNPAQVELVPSERASQLADEFVTLQRQVDDLEARLETEGRGTAGALARLEAARTELSAAEKGMQKPNLSPDDVEELEAAHQAVLEMQDKVGGRVGRRANQQRLEEAMAAEQAVLDRVGFPTWSAYVMGAGLLAIDPMAEQRLERAQAEMAAAEAHWATVAEMIEADPEHRALLDRLESVYLEAFDLLGGDDEQADLEAALRSVQVPKREVSTDELVDALAYQLELVGLNLGTDTPGVDRTIMAADAFLAEVQGISDRVAELEVERDRVQVDLADCRATIERVDAVAAANPTIDLTESASAAEAAAADTDALRAELDRATEEQADYADSLEARLALVDAATQVEAVATSRLMKIAATLSETAAAQPAAGEAARPESDPDFDVDSDAGGPEAIEFYLLARLAAQRSVSYAGSVPMVIDDAFLGLDADEIRSLLGKLEQVSESVQIIYLSDDPMIVDWTASVGLSRAAAVSPTREFA
ncbi:MAG: hypothetical protein ACXWBN_01135 [Acidimicrobiales bacterium]